MNRAFLLIFTFLLVAFSSIIYIPQSYGQIETQEPEVKPKPDPVTLTDKGLSKGMAFNLSVNNFGFSGGANYRHVIGPMTELTANLKFGSVRDPSEQTFTTFFGQQIIPNKFRRGIAIPLTVGLKRRIFAHAIEDNFRLYVSGDGGAAFTLLIPYFEDQNGDGIRNLGRQFFGEQDAVVEPVNDFFQGWSDANMEIGTTGNIAIGADFGDEFSRIISLEFGFNFFFYPQGIQVLEPNRFDPNSSANNIRIIDANPPKKFFATPQISLMFGGMW